MPSGVKLAAGWWRTRSLQTAVDIALHSVVSFVTDGRQRLGLPPKANNSRSSLPAKRHEREQSGSELVPGINNKLMKPWEQASLPERHLARRHKRDLRAKTETWNEPPRVSPRGTADGYLPTSIPACMPWKINAVEVAPGS